MDTERFCCLSKAAANTMSSIPLNNPNQDKKFLSNDCSPYVFSRRMILYHISSSSPPSQNWHQSKQPRPRFPKPTPQTLLSPPDPKHPYLIGSADRDHRSLVPLADPSDLFLLLQADSYHQKWTQMKSNRDDAKKRTVLGSTDPLIISKTKPP